MTTWARVTAIAVFALALLCVAWEAVLAPLRPGGSWLVVKALPLAVLLPGLWRGQLRAYQWLSLVCSLYLLEGLMRWSDAGMAGALAKIETFAAIALFALAFRFARFFPRRPRSH